jgi:hypothetical protein
MMVPRSFSFTILRSKLMVSVALLKESLLSIRSNLITMDDPRLLVLLDLMVLLSREPDVVAAVVVTRVVEAVMAVDATVAEVDMAGESAEAMVVVEEGEDMVEAAIIVVNLATWLGIAAAVEVVIMVEAGMEVVEAAVEATKDVENLVTLPEIAQPMLVRFVPFTFYECDLVGFKFS